MKALNELHVQQSGSIVWFIGHIGTMLRKACHLEYDDRLDVLANYGYGGMIVKANGRRYAMDYTSANAIKVELV